MWSIHAPGSQSELKFWLDIWHNNSTLATQYPELYDICSNPNILLKEVIQSQGESVSFKRQFDEIMHTEWGDILQFISSMSFTHASDKLAWKWEMSGVFSVKSLYRFLNFGGVKVSHALLWWQIPVPHKIKVFMWLMTKNKILTKSNLRKRGWKGSVQCQFCHELESTNHLFLLCPFTQQIWFWMGLSQQYYKN